MAYQVVDTERATENYPTRIRVISPDYETIEEAKTYMEKVKISSPELRLSIREKPPEIIPTVKGYEEYGEPLGETGTTTRTPEEIAELQAKEREQTIKNYEKLYGEEVAQRYAERTEPQYREVEVQTKEEPIAVYGGITHDATRQQIAKAQAEGGRYYMGGTLYSFNPEDRFTREDVMASVYSKMGYSTDVGDKQFMAYTPTKQIVVGTGGSILEAKGTVTEPTALRLYEENIPILRRQEAEYRQTPIEMARSYYANEPFQLYGAWYTLQKPKPITEAEPLGFSTAEGVLSPKEEGQISRLENLGITIERREAARQKLLGAIKYQEGMENIHKFWDFIIPSKRYVPSLIRGHFIGFSEVPFKVVEIATYVPQLPERTAFIVGGMLVPSTRSTFIETHKKGVEAGFNAIGEAVTNPETLGEISAYAIIPAYLKARKGFGKKAEARRVLEDLGKHKPPDIKGTQYYQKPIVKYSIKGDKYVKTPFISKRVSPSKIPISYYEVEYVRPSLFIGKSQPIRFVYGKVTPMAIVNRALMGKRITFNPSYNFGVRAGKVHGTYSLPMEFYRPKGTLPSIRIGSHLSNVRPNPIILSQYERVLYHETLHHLNPLLSEATVHLKTPTLVTNYYFKVKVPIKPNPYYNYVTTPTGTQYITGVLKKGGKTYYIRTTVKPTGLAKTIVYRGDIPLSTFKYTPQTIVKFLEPLVKYRNKEYISMEYFRRQITTKTYKSGTVQITGQPQFIVKGLRVRGIKTFLQTHTIKPPAEVYGKAVYDIVGDWAYIKPYSIKIGKTYYKYVDFLPKQKPIVYTSGDFGVFYKRPAISKTIQITNIKEQIGLQFIEPPKPTPLYKLLKIDQLFKDKTATLSGRKVFIPRITKIPKPTIKSHLAGTLSFSFPDYSALSTYTPTLSFFTVSLAGASLSKQQPRIEPIAKTGIEPITRSEPIILPRNEPIIQPTNEPILENQPKTDLITRQKQNIIQQEKVIQQQQIIQQQTPLLTPTTDIGFPNIPTPPPPTPIIIPPSYQLLKGVPPPTTKAEGYDVLIKRKQLKKGKGSYRSRGYKKANEVPLTKKAALGLGASIVDTYTNRSFTIRKANKKAQLRRDLEQKWDLLSEKFRRAKNRPNIAVEKSTYAIDSMEERRGIPYEAARLKRLKLLNIKQKRNTLIKFSNSFLKSKKKKRKGVNKWL